MIFADKDTLKIHKWWEWTGLSGLGRGDGVLRRKRKEEGGQQDARQYVHLADMNKQRLLGYAESFRELAESLQGEFTTNGVIGDRQSILEERMLWENRRLLGNNLSEMADIMAQVADKELCYEPMEEKKRKSLVHALRAEGIFAENFCYLPGENGHKAIGILLHTEKKGGISSDEVANMLSVLLKIRLEASVTSPYLVDDTKRSFVFVEEAKFITFTGLSKAVKETETVSGDNFSVLQSETGKMTVLLSDGTGSGQQANGESSRVLDLMEKMLEAGFGMETAINMVNSAVLSRGEQSNHPTLDICSLDLYGGSCNIWKIGGALTLLKSGNTVDKIRQQTLPLGIFQKQDIPMLHRELMDGDYLIFMTDGVLDALAEMACGEEECEDLLSETVRTMQERNPQEMAERLLQLVLKNSSGHIHDDMTILVVGIWENT